MTLRLAPVLLAAAATITPVTGLDHAAFLKKHAGFTESDLKKADRGEVVARTLAADAGEVALAAATVVRVPVSFYLERFRSIESFKRSAEVLEIGRFSNPPTAADLRGLTVDADDIARLRSCRSGSCDLKLPDEAIARLSKRTDVDNAFREWLADYTARYAREGNSALAVYHHEKDVHRITDSLRQMLIRAPYLPETWPAVSSVIGAFSGHLPDGLEQFYYWSKEKPPGKVVINATHVVLQPESAGTAVVATKQIYASHYMHASIGLSVLIDRSTPQGPRTLVIYMNRTQVDLFEGVMGKMLRPIVRSRARASAERMLRGLRTRLEQEYASRQQKG